MNPEIKDNKFYTELNFSKMLKLPSVKRVNYLHSMNQKFPENFTHTEDKYGYTNSYHTKNSEILWKVLYGKEEKVTVTTKKGLFKKTKHNKIVDDFYSIMKRY